MAFIRLMAKLHSILLVCSHIAAVQKQNLIMPFLSFALRIKLRVLNYVSGLWAMALISSVSTSYILYDLLYSSHLMALSFAIHSDWNALLLPALVPGPTPAKPVSFRLLRQFMCYFLHVDLQWSFYYELGTLPIIII